MRNLPWNTGRAMSAQNVELVRRALTARRSEFEEVLDPRVRLDLSERVFNPAVYEGYEGILRWRAEVGDVWEYYRTEPVQFLDSGDVVVVLARERARGKGSGVEVDRNTALLYKLSGGRVSEIRLYHDRQRALRDAGLAGQRRR
jgi:ketosteroid isomerase-like protein